jgi:hypothetical protein
MGGEVMEAVLATLWIWKQVMKKLSVDHIVKKEGVEVCGIHQEARRGDKQYFSGQVDKRRGLETFCHPQVKFRD